MILLALAPLAWIILAMLLLLGAGVLVRYTFDLVKHAKSLVTTLKTANDRLQDAAIEVRVESAEAAERVSKLGRPAAERR